VVGESAKLQENTGRYIKGGETLIYNTVSSLEERFPFFREAKVNEEIMMWVSNVSTHFAKDYLADIIIELAKWLPALLLVPYLTYFLLDDAQKFKKFLVATVPNAFFEKTLLLVFRVGEQVRRYFQGLMLLTLLDAVCLSSGLYLLGVNHAIALGILTSVLAWIPYVGSVVGCLIVVLVSATDFPDQAWIAYGAVGIFIAVRMLDDFVFMPLTILRVHPLITVLMIFIGGAVAGVSGLLLVLPVLGIVMVFGEIIGEVVTDERLRARHTLARELHRRKAEEHLS
jgi:predicted PurR-regulated permease PerM